MSKLLETGNTGGNGLGLLRQKPEKHFVMKVKHWLYVQTFKNTTWFHRLNIE